MEGIWPLVILWVLALLLGGSKKKRPADKETAETQDLDLMKAEFERLRQVEQAARRKIERRGRGSGAGDRDKKPERKVYHPKPVEGRGTSRKQPRYQIEIGGDPTVATLEGRDYDEDAERVVAARRQVAERRSVSSEALTEAQAARRAGRVEVEPDAEKRHVEFHGRMAASAAPAPATAVRRSSPLARFADGSLRSAIVLATILNRPVGER